MSPFPTVFSKGLFPGTSKGVIVWKLVNSLPKEENLEWSKLKVYADDIINFIEMIISLLYRVENFVGKGENAGYQHFLLFPHCFQNASCLGPLKSQDCVVKSYKRRLLWVGKSQDSVNPITKQQNFDQDQIESICRRQS